MVLAFFSARLAVVQGAGARQCRQAKKLLYLPLSLQTGGACADHPLLAPVPHRGERESEARLAATQAREFNCARVVGGRLNDRSSTLRCVYGILPRTETNGFVRLTCDCT